MDKLRRVLSGDEPTPEEESSIITQVKFSYRSDFIEHYVNVPNGKIISSVLEFPLGNAPLITWRQQLSDSTLIGEFS